MRGQPDLLFWRIEPTTRTLSSETTTSHVNDEDDRKHDRDGFKSNVHSRNGTKRTREHDNFNVSGEGRMYCAHSVFAVEVKSASDRLSEWQCAWLSLLSEAGVHSEELKITN